MRSMLLQRAVPAGVAAGMAAALLLSSPIFAHADDALPTAREIIDGSIKAAGGREALDKIESFRAEGSINIPQFDEIKLILMHDNKGRFAIEQEMPGMGSMKVGSDGTYGWAQNVMTGQWDLMDDAMLAGSRQQVELFQRIAPPDEVVARMKTVAKVTRRDRPTWQVRLAEENGTEQMLFFDVETKRLSSVEFDQDTGAGMVRMTMTFSDWKPTDDLTFFRRVEMTGMMGMDVVLNFRVIKVNTLDGKEFVPPGPVAEQIRQREAAKKAAEAAREIGKSGGDGARPGRD